eukprot:TRINITY_DN11011_c0_g1_i1.p1 TRINITY_DN11011_c0_g1~~TRINITY_DN11011_c0_g1_i1.p1  ORF type:complete len:702 (+),score=185.88 TRINITY_DN11011_c0_g1_i1:63-2108(+)
MATVQNTSSTQPVPMDTSQMIYQPPPWSAQPKSAFRFEVLKSGQIIDDIDLSEKPFYILGRHGELCDIVLDHPSSSRQHAVLQHKGDDEVYLFDLESSHGTFINKQQIQPRKFCRIRDGDMIKFGQSLRLYIFNGGPQLTDEQREADRMTRRLARHQKELDKKLEAEQISERIVAMARDRDGRAAQLAAAQKKREEDLAEGISWGFGEDAENEPDEIEFEPTGPSGKPQVKNEFTGLSKADRRRLAREKKAEQKEMDTAMEKSGRARRPHKDDSVTIVDDEGNAVSMNPNDASAAADADTEEQESEDQKRLREEAAELAQQYFARHDNDDDDFFDRTGRAKKDAKKGAVENLESLQTRMSDILLQQKGLKRDMAVVEAESTAASETEDALDAYLVTLNQSDKKERIKKLQNQWQELENEKTRVAKLLQIIAPALTGLGGSRVGAAPIAKPRPMVLTKPKTSAAPANAATTEASSITTASTPSATSPSTTTATASATTIGSMGPPPPRAKPAKVSFAMLPPPPRRKVMDVFADQQAKPSSTTSSVADSITEKRPLVKLSPPSSPEPDQQQQTQQQEQGHDDDDNELSAKRARNTSNSDAADTPESVAIPDMIMGNSEDAPVLVMLPPQPEKKRGDRGKKKTTHTVSMPDMLESGDGQKDYEWIPPVGQSGDGTTALNARFGY